MQVWDRDFEKVWGFKVVLVAEQWRQSQAIQRQQASATAAAQQQQQQMYQPRDPKSASGSPPSAHSSPGTGASSSPYDGRRDGNARTLLRSHASMSDLDAAYSPTAQTNLPSLKASGLLDSWKPPSDAFANALSLGTQSQSQSPSATRVAQGQPIQQGLPGVSNGVAPVGLDWLTDGGARQ